VAWRRGIVVIASASWPENRGFESSLGVGFIEFCILQCCCLYLKLLGSIVYFEENKCRKMFLKKSLFLANNFSSQRLCPYFWDLKFQARTVLSARSGTHRSCALLRYDRYDLLAKIAYKHLQTFVPHGEIDKTLDYRMGSGWPDEFMKKSPQNVSSPTVFFCQNWCIMLAVEKVANKVGQILEFN
jgi:hypothetical protein